MRAAGRATAGYVAPERGPYALPRIPYLRLRFTLRSLGHAHLPRYKGSLLRGAFGHSLRTAVCAMGPTQPCGSCRLKRACVYTRVFETFIDDEPPPFLRGLDTSPRPYIFEPRCDEQNFPPGAELEFDLLLIGQAIDLQAYALLAVERMASTGLGRDRHRFTVARVQSLAMPAGWQEIGTLARGEAGRATMPEAPTAVLPSLTETPPSRAQLRFLTATRIKIRDRLASTIDIRHLIFNMLRRTLELAHFHVPDAKIDWSFHHLLDDATAVQIVAEDLHWHDWQRYSNRQQTKMALGGFVGSVEIQGNLAPVWPLLRTAEVLHVGKGATFGLGNLRIDVGD